MAPKPKPKPSGGMTSHRARPEDTLRIRFPFLLNELTTFIGSEAIAHIERFCAEKGCTFSIRGKRKKLPLLAILGKNCVQVWLEIRYYIRGFSTSADWAWFLSNLELPDELAGLNGFDRQMHIEEDSVKVAHGGNHPSEVKLTPAASSVRVAKDNNRGISPVADDMTYTSRGHQVVVRSNRRSRSRSKRLGCRTKDFPQKRPWKQEAHQLTRRSCADSSAARSCLPLPSAPRQSDREDRRKVPKEDSRCRKIPDTEEKYRRKTKKTEEKYRGKVPKSDGMTSVSDGMTSVPRGRDARACKRRTSA